MGRAWLMVRRGKPHLDFSVRVGGGIRGFEIAHELHHPSRGRAMRTRRLVLEVGEAAGRVAPLDPGLCRPSTALPILVIISIFFFDFPAIWKHDILTRSGLNAVRFRPAEDDVVSSAGNDRVVAALPGIHALDLVDGAALELDFAVIA